MRVKLPVSELAWRNLVHDRVRLAVTLTGIVFAVVLIVVELGLFVGFTTTTSGLIDRSHADLWVMSARVRYVEVGAVENIVIALDVRGVRGHAARAQADDLLNQVGFSSKRDSYPAELSGARSSGWPSPAPLPARRASSLRTNRPRRSI